MKKIVAPEMKTLKAKMSNADVLEAFFADKALNTKKGYHSAFSALRISSSNPILSMKKMTKLNLYNRCKALSKSHAYATIHKYIEYLAGFADYLMFLDILDTNIPDKVKKYIPKDPVQKRPTKCFTQEEIVQAMSSNVSALWKAVYALAFYTGMRVSEISKIQVADIAPDFSFVTLRMTKNKTDRVQPIPEAVRPILKTYSETRPNRSYFLVSHQGKQLKPISIYKHFKSKLGKAPHAARASVVTRLKLKGCDPKTIADFVGHRTIGEQNTYDKRENQAVEALKYLVN